MEKLATEKAEKEGTSQEKANAEMRKSELKTLHERMDEHIKNVRTTLNNRARAKHTTGFWATWSKVVEKTSWNTMV